MIFKPGSGDDGGQGGHSESDGRQDRSTGKRRQSAGQELSQEAAGAFAGV